MFHGFSAGHKGLIFFGQSHTSWDIVLFLKLTHGTILGSSVVPREVCKNDLKIFCVFIQPLPSKDYFHALKKYLLPTN
jgi:hypothetical protein